MPRRRGTRKMKRNSRSRRGGFLGFFESAGEKQCNLQNEKFKEMAKNQTLSGQQQSQGMLGQSAMNPSQQMNQDFQPNTPSYGGRRRRRRSTKKRRGSRRH